MPLFPTQAQILKDTIKLEAEAMVSLRAEIEAARQDLRTRILGANPDSYVPDVLGQVATAVQAVTDGLAAGMMQKHSAFLLRAINLGVDFAEAGLPGQSVALGVGFHFPKTTLDALVGFNATKIVQITDELRGRVNSIVKQGILSGKGVPAVAKQIGLTGIEPIGPFKTVQARANAIARTELNRAANMASWDRYQAAKAFIPGMDKEWVATKDHRTRASHLAANGQTVPLDDPFRVGGHPCQYPHDPALPAGEVVFCRCRLVVVVPRDPDGAADLDPDEPAAVNRPKRTRGGRVKRGPADRGPVEVSRPHDVPAPGEKIPHEPLPGDPNDPDGSKALQAQIKRARAALRRPRE